MTTMDSAIMMVWLTASAIVDLASGRCTLSRVWRPGGAERRRRPRPRVGETRWMASAVIRMAGGIE